MAKHVTFGLDALAAGGVQRTAKEVRDGTLQAQLGDNFEAWKPNGYDAVPKPQRIGKKASEHGLQCDATHGWAWKLLKITKGSKNRRVGFGFARKYLGLDYDDSKL